MNAIKLPIRRPRTAGPVANEAEEDEPGPASLSELYAKHRLPLVRLAVLLVDDLATAEDVVQDAFATLHAKWGQLRGEAAALRYLQVSVVNNARSALRRRRTARRWLAQQSRTEAFAADERMLAAEHRHVMEALRQLTPRQREVLVLRYWLDQSEAQIAETLGISRGSVKSTASRALDVLEQLLEGAR